MKHQCPFCNEYIEQYEFCNGICKCFAKYYANENVWLNRNTGEIRKGTYKLEYIEEWSEQQWNG